MQAQRTLLTSASMPQDCNLVMYTSAGNGPSNAVYSSGTYKGTPPCALTVSSSGGGFITVADSNHTVLYLRPANFGVLINANENTTYNFPTPDAFQTLDLNEVYDVATGVVSQTATNFNQHRAGARTFLPTIKAVLSVGGVGQQTQTGTGPPYYNSELYSTASRTWVSAGTPVGGNTQELALVTLFSGEALLVGQIYTYNSSTDYGFHQDNQIYSPATGAWRKTAPLSLARQALGVSLLRNGRVLVSGGAPLDGGVEVYDSAELYDPLAGTWSSESAHLPVHEFPPEE